MSPLPPLSVTFCRVTELDEKVGVFSVTVLVLALMSLMLTEP
jgi:hypothetical protein